MEKLNPQKTYANQKTQVISLEKGKIPPQAIDLEEVVLGAMMVDKRGVDEVIDILHPSVVLLFHKELAIRFLVVTILLDAIFTL